MNRTAISAFVLAATVALGASPVWSQDDPQAPRLEFAFEEIVTLGPAIPVGETPLGKRNIIPITGGTFEGPGIKGTIIAGGWDWQLTRADGCTDVDSGVRAGNEAGIDAHEYGENAVAAAACVLLAVLVATGAETTAVSLAVNADNGDGGRSVARGRARPAARRT